MAKETTYAGVLGDLQRFIGPLQANISELPHLEAPRAKLAALLARAQELVTQQRSLTAAKQETSQELKTLVVESQRLANAMRAMIREHFGIRAEKLAEFGLQPFRGRTRKAGSTPGQPASADQSKPAPQPVSPDPPTQP
jgi:hypothetical protein